MVVFRSYYLTMIALFIILMNLVNTNGEYILSAFVTNEADALEAAGALVGSRGDFMTGDNLKAYWAREKAIHEKMLREIGEIE